MPETGLINKGVSQDLEIQIESWLVRFTLSFDILPPHLN